MLVTLLKLLKLLTLLNILSLVTLLIWVFGFIWEKIIKQSTNSLSENE